MFPVTTYILIVTGGLIIIIGCLGCFGACQESRVILFTVSILYISKHCSTGKPQILEQ